MRPRWCLPLLPLLFAGLALADGPADNLPDKVRPIPKPGIIVPQRDRAELEQELAALGKDIEALRTALKSKPALLELLPDVEVFHKAVRYALQYNEFFSDKEIPVAKALLKQGRERAAALRDGQAPWAAQTGLVVRGYVSKIDGSVQPYGLVVPASYRPDSPYKHRLDLWWHGRGETLSELNFINQRQRSPGEFAPRDAFVLHPYGRYCNANKFAGEIDTFEAMDHVKKHYRIDDNRIVARGFSMGGAACWQFAVHYPDVWAAAAPGAGFSETADFLKVFQQEKLQPTWYEQKLWHLYDCTDYALNLFNCPTVAYSGENDSQKQAADMMARALEAEGIKLTHIIGKRAKHHYTPEAKAEINRRMDRLAELGRRPVPEAVLFTTWTLRYNRAYWVRVDGLEKHWSRAEVLANLGYGTPVVKTKNVSALTLVIPPGDWKVFNPSLRKSLQDLLPGPEVPPSPEGQPAPKAHLDQQRTKRKGLVGPRLIIDGTNLDGPPVQSDRSWTVHLRKIDGNWKVVDSPDDGTL
ncbi:MAG TPA: prolyl oligopeptidase family serine peptidase, partial [Gemmataceae bacterium]|nr:prolyl oligopeptidase family serine peptidase [Gemmataceae bacterium]